MSGPNDLLLTIGNALVATIQEGSWNGKPIRCELVSGRAVDGEIKPPAVVVAPPAIGFSELASEALWGVTESEWPLMLHIAKGREPDTATELQFTMAVLNALAADPTLGGVVELVRPLASDTPTPVAPPEGPPVMFRRTLRVHVTHTTE